MGCFSAGKTPPQCGGDVRVSGQRGTPPSGARRGFPVTKKYPEHGSGVFVFCAAYAPVIVESTLDVPVLESSSSTLVSTEFAIRLSWA